MIALISSFEQMISTNKFELCSR